MNIQLCILFCIKNLIVERFYFHYLIKYIFEIQPLASIKFKICQLANIIQFVCINFSNMNLQTFIILIIINLKHKYDNCSLSEILY